MICLQRRSFPAVVTQRRLSLSWFGLLKTMALWWTRWWTSTRGEPEKFRAGGNWNLWEKLLGYHKYFMKAVELFWKLKKQLVKKSQGDFRVSFSEMTPHPYTYMMYRKVILEGGSVQRVWWKAGPDLHLYQRPVVPDFMSELVIVTGDWIFTSLQTSISEGGTDGKTWSQRRGCICSSCHHELPGWGWNRRNGICGADFFQHDSKFSCDINASGSASANVGHDGETTDGNMILDILAVPIKMNQSSTRLFILQSHHAAVQ